MIVTNVAPRWGKWLTARELEEAVAKEIARRLRHSDLKNQSEHWALTVMVPGARPPLVELENLQSQSPGHFDGADIEDVTCLISFGDLEDDLVRVGGLLIQGGKRRSDGEFIFRPLRPHEFNCDLDRVASTLAREGKDSS